MKKTNRFIAMATSLALAAGMAGSLNADAIGAFAYDLDIEGYEVVDLSVISWDNSSGLQRYYWDKETHHSIRILSAPKYNFVIINIDNSDESIARMNEIYGKYESELDFDSTYQNDNPDGIWFQACDNYDKDGNQTFDASAMPDKSALVQKFVDELYEAGIVKKAEYTKMQMYMQVGDFYDTSSFIVKCNSMSADDFGKISEMLSVADVTATVSGESGITEFRVDNISDSTEFVNMMTQVKAICPDAEIKIPEDKYCIICSTEGTSLGKTVNLLDPYICDIDGSGNADVSDASAVLKAYAENAAGLQKASEENKMDVNGDGEVNIEDASYILTYYAESAAGMR